VASVNGQAGIVATEGNDLVLKPATDAGTIVFHDASAAGGGGTTSVRAMVAQFDSVATDLEATKTSVNDELTRVTEDVDKRLNAQKQTLDDEIATITAGVEDKLTTAATETDQKIGTVQGDLKTGLEAVTASISTEVKPQIDAVTAELKALETKISDNVDGKLVAVTKALMGLSAAVPAPNCGAIIAARPDALDGKYYIDSKYQTAPVNVHCRKVGSTFVSMGGDCSSKAAACHAFLNGGNYCKDGEPDKRWIDGDANAEDTGNAKQQQCQDPLMIKLCTTDGKKQTFDAGFWSNNNLMSADKAKSFTTHKGDIKTKQYLAPMGKRLEIRAYIGTKKLGSAFYDVLPAYQKRSLKFMVHDNNKNNIMFAKRDNDASASDKPIQGTHLKQQGGNAGQQPYDMFLDTRGDLVARHKDYYGASSHTRLSSTDNSGGRRCHVFSGIGGKHACGGYWRIEFEASPIIGYCSTYNKYGTDHGPNTRPHNCRGGGFKQTNVDFAILLA